jgi:hypothetical protein
MINITSQSEATQAITQLLSLDNLELLNTSQTEVFHGLELVEQLEICAQEGKTQKICQLLKQGGASYTFPDQELFLHFYAYSESVMAAINLNMNLEKEAQKNIDNTKTAFEISNAIKQFEAKK